MTFSKCECKSTLKNCLVYYEHPTDEIPERGTESSGIEAKLTCECVR